MTNILAVSDLVRLEVDGGVAVVTVDNPPVNALTNQTLDALGNAAMQIEDAAEVRAVVLAGAGEQAWIAGADIDEFRAALGSTDWIEEHTSLTRRVFTLWERLRHPVIAAVQASAVGGGLELALLCDIVVADPIARFGFPEVTLGLMPGAGGTQRLPRRVSPLAAREMLLLGLLVDAARAADLGLVTRICTSGEAVDEAMRIAQHLATLPARAVQAVKQALRGEDEDLALGLDRERKLFLELFASEDVREGLAAFVEKRVPAYRHR